MSFIENLCEKTRKNSFICPKIYENPLIKRGLRNSDGSGVVAGITNICMVHGYVINEGELEPRHGDLIYRGINIKDIVGNLERDGRYGFEETCFLLLTGELPNADYLAEFSKNLTENRLLPQDFFKDMILAAPSPDVMNKMARSVLALYSYDDDAANYGLSHEFSTAISLIAKLPTIMIASYQVKKSHYDNASMIMHKLRSNENTAQTILSTLRDDRSYTEQEARLLDTLLILHAEHGGGNNSTFACRVLTSANTDPYAAYSAAIGSLKGKRHGGANINTLIQMDRLKEEEPNWRNEGAVADYLAKLVKKEAGDHTGLIYGMGHAVYTLSDPRAEILKGKACALAKGTEFEEDYRLLDTIEKLAGEVMKKTKGSQKPLCANVDLYSGLVYKMLNIPEDVITPLFACARIAGWAAHRLEEIITSNKIIRPAYKSVSAKKDYSPFGERNGL